MSSISNITSSCKGLVDQMNQSSQGWHDPIQQSYYSRRLSPLVSTAAEYQTDVYSYMRLLDGYERRIASMAGFGPMGTGIGENELYRQQIDPQVLEYIRSKQY